MLNPLAPVTDYQSMLNRIFWFTSASAMAAIWVLRSHIPAVDATLRQIDFAVAWQGASVLPTPGGTLLPALAIAMAARIFRLHARIGDWLGVREIFDLEVIIHELARQLSVDLEPIGEPELRRQRHKLMRQAFYPYVSGPQPAVDSLLIHQALDAWSWLWIGLEATLLWALAGYALLAAEVPRLGFQTLGATAAFAALVLPALRTQCKRYAIAQVRTILADPGRAAAVKQVFHELGATAPGPRLAA